MTTVCLIALGPISDEVLEAVRDGLDLAYGVAITNLPRLPEPDHAHDAHRGQYSSSVILRDIVRQLPSGATRILAITGKDLFIPMLSFVLGQAQLNGPAAVISTARLHQEFYGLPADPTLLHGRVAKEAVHEIGHTFGLTHCADSRCPMSLSNGVRQVDAKSAMLCRACMTMVSEFIPSFLSHRSPLHGTGSPQ